MPSTPPLALSTDYAFNAPAAQDKVRASNLDSNNAAFNAWAEELLAGLGVTIRDDDTLVDAIVRSRNLHPEVVALIASKAGWQPKADVQAASVVGVNINLAAPGAAIDGRTMQANDRFLAKDQTDSAENGIYVWNGASAAATRATDADTATELGYAFVTVAASVVAGVLSAQAGTSWVCNQSADDIVAVDTTALTFGQVGGQFLPSAAMKPVVEALTLPAGRLALGISAAVDPVVVAATLSLARTALAVGTEMGPVMNATTLDLAAAAFTYKATGGTADRSMRDREGDRLNAKDLGADGGGVVSNSAIFAGIAAGKTIVVSSGTYRFSTDCTIVCDLDFRDGGKLSVDTGKTVTINGGIIAQETQIFYGLGVFNGIMGGNRLSVTWWGAVGDGDSINATGTDNAPALMAAIACANNYSGASRASRREVFVSPGTYGISQRIDIPSGVVLRGAGPGATSIHNLSGLTDVNGILRTVEGGYGQPPGGIYDLSILGNNLIGAGTPGVVLAANGSSCVGCWLGGFPVAQIRAASTNQIIDRCVCDNGITANCLGIEVTAVAVQVSECTIYAQNIGLFIHDLSAASGYGPVKVTDVFMTNPIVNGFGVLVRDTAGMPVRLSGITMHSEDATGYEYGGIKIESAPNVHATDCLMELASASSAAVGYQTLGVCTDSIFNDCSTKYAYIGASMVSDGMVLRGGKHVSSGLYGVFLGVVSSVVVDGVSVRACATGVGLFDGSSDCAVSNCFAYGCTVGFQIAQNAATYNALKNCHSVSTTDLAVTGTPANLIKSGNTNRVGAI